MQRVDFHSPIVGDVRDVGWILGSGRPPGEGNGNPLQYSCLENPMDRGAWLATVRGATKAWDTTGHLSTRADNLPSHVKADK